MVSQDFALSFFLLENHIKGNCYYEKQAGRYSEKKYIVAEF